MRLQVSGNHPSAVDLRELFRSVGWRTDSSIPSVHLQVDTIAEKSVSLSCGNERLRYLLLEQMSEEGVDRVLVFSTVPGVDCFLSIPSDLPEGVQAQVERATFRAFLRYAKERVPIWARWSRLWTVAAALLLFGANVSAEPLIWPAFIRLMPQSDTPTGLQPFKVDLQRVAGVDLTGANVVDGANSAFRVNCITGCTGGGGSSFTDNTAFTAGTTSISNIGGVFNDGLSAISSGNAAAARITNNRGLHVNLRDASGNALLGQAAMAASIPVTLASNQSALSVTATNLFALDTSVNGVLNPIVTQGTTVPSKIEVVGGKTNDATAQFREIPEGAGGRSVIVEGIAGGTTVPVSGTVTTTPPANASTNVAQFGGTNVSTGTGVGGAGIPRVTVSSDSSLAANQSVNVAQFGGTNVNTGLGPSGTGTPRVTASLDDMAGSVTLNATTACPAATTTVATSAGCIVVPIAGMSGVSFQVVNSALSATIVPEYSADGGTTFQGATYYVASVQSTGSQVYTASSATQNYDMVLAGNYSHVRLRMSSFTSGSTVASGRATHIVPYINNPCVGVVGLTANIVGCQTFGTTNGGIQQPINVDVKGVQSTRGLGVQHLHDAGRTAISFYANAVASGTTGTETLITLTQSKGTAATSSSSSYTITNGKTLRIERLQVASLGNATATAQNTTFNFRLNTGGACIVTSTPILWATVTATPATSSAFDRAPMDLPDGYEIAGNGTISICISANAVFTTNAPTWFVNIIGFEY